MMRNSSTLPIIKNMMNQSELLRLIENGILAPSADNLQAWKFRTLGNQIDLFLDSTYTQNFCDEGLFAPYLSAGAVIENARVAAAEYQYTLIPSYFPNSQDPTWVATLRLTKNDSSNAAYFPVLRQRLTNRKFYLRKKIDELVYSNLDRLVEAGKDFKLIWIKKNDTRYQKLSQILGDADQMRFENKRLHREFIQTMRFTKQEREQTRDGLDYRTLEAGPGSVFLFKLISSWNRLRLMNLIGMSHLFNVYTQLQLKSSEACGLIVSKNHTPMDYVVGGEIMERLWHEVTLQNLSLQPIEALPIFLIHLKETGAPEFDPKQKRKLEDLKKTFYSLFPIQETNGLIFLFRIGYASQPKIRSTRRNVESFLVK